MNRKERRIAAKLAQSPGNSATMAAQAANLFSAGVAHHQAGRLAEAIAAYTEAIRIKPDHAEAYGNLGVAFNNLGKFEEALAAYRQAIRIKPDFARAHYNLGNLLNEQGDREAAAAAYAQAIRIKPDFAEAHTNLGNALNELGKRDEAVAAHAQAIRIKPDLAQAHYNLGIALNDQGKRAEAAAAYRQAIRSKEAFAQAHYSLGNALREQGKSDEAIASYHHAIRIKPDYAEAYCNLGVALKQEGNRDEAITAYRNAIRIKPAHAKAHSNLGTALCEQGNLEEALAVLRKAISIEPRNAEAYSNLGNALKEQGKLDEAVAAYTEAIRIKPDLAETHSNLGVALHEQGKLEQAVTAYREALRLKPDHAEGHSNLGNALNLQGKRDEAIAAYREAIRIQPDFAGTFSNLLFALNYDDRLTADQLFATHCEWDERYGRHAVRPSSHANSRLAERRLKVGYVSPDFRRHSVAYFLEPLLRAHDHEAVELFCYAEVARPDAVTHHLRSFADHWLLTVGMSDGSLAQRISADGIDILVDLAGHTARNRLCVFARKPAPVQVTWLGYPNTTGAASIDYRLVDAITDPQGTCDTLASETLIRVPDGFLCYAPLIDAPPPFAPPSQASGVITFGSFNNPAKTSAATLDVWAALLGRLPASRLLLKGLPFADGASRAACLARLGERGVAAERVDLVERLPGNAAHLSAYQRLDIALDPFPYNGTTTTCEALWMGVPVVTRMGERHASRVSASLLSQVGLTDLIAGSDEEYVEIALALAHDPGRLRDLRYSLRPRVAASPLCDAHAFARKIEAIYRTMWQNWCEAR
jgi:predicted O-linked N-acetylglucosamine transferase (SPINDLY family)